MNFLAHIYLSFDLDEVRLGNFIADHLKGNAYKDFAPNIQKGVLLHRAIDHFTDTHPIYKQSCKRIFHSQGHYSRVVIDIFYDYFLASQWAQYHEKPLEDFAQEFYKLLTDHFESLPPKTQHLAPFMTAQNWLVAYASHQGIDRILKGMHQRTSYASKMDTAALDLKKYEGDLRSDFEQFFPELIIFSKNKLSQLNQ